VAAGCSKGEAPKIPLKRKKKEKKKKKKKKKTPTDHPGTTNVKLKIVVEEEKFLLVRGRDKEERGARLGSLLYFRIVG